MRAQRYGESAGVCSGCRFEFGQVVEFLRVGCAVFGVQSSVFVSFLALVRLALRRMDGAEAVPPFDRRVERRTGERV